MSIKPAAYYALQNEVKYLYFDLDEAKSQYPHVVNWIPLYALTEQVTADARNQALEDAKQRIKALSYGETQDSNEAAYNMAVVDGERAIEALKRN